MARPMPRACVFLVLAFCGLGTGNSEQMLRQSSLLQRHRASLESQVDLGLQLERGMDKAWEGFDVGGLDGLQLADRIGSQQPQSNVTRKHIQIMGLQNTGTNLLNQLLGSNFGSVLMFHDWSVLPKYGYGPNKKGWQNRRPGIWKHANIKEKFATEPEKIRQLNRRGVVPLMMVRNPLAWLESIHKAPYELERCVNGSDWLTRPCEHKIPCGYRSDCNRASYSSLAAVWNEWNNAYNSFDKHGFNRGMVIRYEDLVFSSARELRRIAKYLDIKIPAGEHLSQVRSSAKDHGESHGKAEAMRKIKQREYMATYTAKSLAAVCERLDSGLQRAFEYDDCKGKAKGTK